ncbi:MAG: response regulator [Planctomycetota bacterium]
MNDLKKKILVVEDDPDIREILQLKLSSAGFDVTTAATGLEGLNKVYQDSPHLIILDLMLPQLDGYQMCRILKFDERYKDIPIIMLTGKAEDKSMKLGLKAGADKYLTKPFEPEHLLSEIRQFLL